MGFWHRLGQACVWAGLGFILAGLVIEVDELAGWVMTGVWTDTPLESGVGASDPEMGNDGFVDAVLRRPLWVQLVVIGAAMGLLGLALQDGKPPK
jgi:hypothetical protein